MLIAARALVEVFAEASAEAEVTSQVLHGWRVEVLERDGPWGRVRTGDGYSGWVRVEELAEVVAEAGLRVEGLSANVYRKPDVKRRRAMMQVPWEGRLWELGEDGVWMRVRLGDGREGFVHRGDVAREWPRVGVQEMLAVGQRFLGVTYTWGGVSSFGYDCSGFVQMLMRQRGIGVPRDAQAQARWEGFVSIGVDEAGAGDVLFFGETEDEITHVGMCMGGGTFIHSTTEGKPGVQVSRIAEEPWRTRVCGARRVRD